PEERVLRMVVEVDLVCVLEHGHVALEAVGEPSVERRAGAARARARAVVLGDEGVGALALVDVVAGRGGLLDALREDPGHEECEVADVPSHDHLALGLEGRPVLPDGLCLEEHVHDRLEARHREPPRVEIVGAREAREEIGEVRRGGIVAQGQVAEARSDRPTEELPELHNPDDSKTLLESEPVAERSGAKLSWMLVVASLLFLVLLLYVVCVGYLPAKQWMAAAAAGAAPPEAPRAEGVAPEGRRFGDLHEQDVRLGRREGVPALPQARRDERALLEDEASGLFPVLPVLERRERRRLAQAVDV